MTGKGFRKTICALGIAAALSGSLAGCGTEKQPTTYELGMEALEKGSYTEAVSYFQDMLNNETGTEAEAYRGLGIAAVRQKDYDTAISWFQKCLDAIPENRNYMDFTEDVLFYQANAYTQNGDTDKAMNLYNQLLTGKHAGRAYLLRGILYADDGKFGQAGQDFRKAVDRDDSYEVYLQIYTCYARNNREADGAAYLKEAQEKIPQTPEESYEMGRINFELKDSDAAINDLKTAVEGKVDGAVMLLGKIYLLNKDTDSARELFRSGLSTEGQGSVCYNGLALCDIADGDYDSALSNISSGLSSGDGKVQEELLFNEIIVYEKKLDFPTALEKAKAFAESYPQNTDAARELKFLQNRTKATPPASSDTSGGTGSTGGTDSTEAGTESGTGTGTSGGTAESGYGDGSADTSGTDGAYSDGTYTGTDGTYSDGTYAGTDGAYGDGTYAGTDGTYGDGTYSGY